MTSLGTLELWEHWIVWHVDYVSSKWLWKRGRRGDFGERKKKGDPDKGQHGVSRSGSPQYSPARTVKPLYPDGAETEFWVLPAQSWTTTKHLNQESGPYMEKKPAPAWQTHPGLPPHLTSPASASLKSRSYKPELWAACCHFAVPPTPKQPDCWHCSWLPTHRNKLVRYYGWRHCTLSPQEMKKSVWNSSGHP